MKSFSIKGGWLALCAVLIFSGCRVDPQEEIDTLLDQALRDASGGAGRGYYQLPTDGDLRSIPADPRNPITREKVELGKFLFHETALGTNPRLSKGAGTYSCASCHHVQAAFSAGRVQGIGEGGSGFGIFGEARRADPNYILDSIDVQPIRTPTALNAAYQKVSLWNGQFGAVGPNAGTENLWAYGTPIANNNLGYEGPETQAIAGLTVHRQEVGPDLLQRVPAYRQLFRDAFPNIPESQRVTTENAGLAIAAYERTLLASQAPFQKWLRGDVNAMDDQEKNGALLFFGKARCYTCHNGPALNSDEFHAIGMNALLGGEIIGSDPTHEAHLGRGGFTGNQEDMYAFKVPQLYNLRDMGFYGHGSTFSSLQSVVQYKNAGVPQDRNVPVSNLAQEFQPLNLGANEVADLVRFLETGLYDDRLQRHVPYSTPSGQCFPNSDPVSRADLGCN